MSKPSTPAQAEASRANGAKSQGPTSARGKFNSSRNALKHGLTATKHVLIPGESRKDFETLRDAFLDRHQPEDAATAAEVELLATTLFRLRRIQRMEADTIRVRLNRICDEVEEELDEGITYRRADHVGAAYRYEHKHLDMFQKRTAAVFNQYDRTRRFLTRKLPNQTQHLIENEVTPENA
jgi:hypothetical protein